MSKFREIGVHYWNAKTNQLGILLTCPSVGQSGDAGCDGQPGVTGSIGVCTPGWPGNDGVPGLKGMPGTRGEIFYKRSFHP